MDVKVRGVDAAAVAKIDQIAKSQNISRNEFLKRQIEHIAFFPDLLSVENKYRNLVNEIIPVIEQNNKLYDEIIDLMRED